MATDYEQVLEAMRVARDSGDMEKARRMAEILRRLDSAPATLRIPEKDILSNPTAPDMTTYLLDRAKKGLASSAETAGKIGSFMTPPAGEFGSMEEMFAAARRRPDTAAQEAINMRTNVENQLDFRNYRPPATAMGDMAEYPGAAVEAFSDVQNLALPTGIAKTVGGGIVERMFGSILPAMTSKAGEQIDKELGGSGFTGALVGGFAGGYGNARIGRSVQAVPKVIDAIRTRLPEAIKNTATSQAEQHFRNLLKVAVEADPDVALNLQRVLAENPDAAIGVIASNGPLRAAVASMASRHPSFKNTFMKQWDDSLNALKVAQVDMFGNPVQAQGIMSDNLGEMRTEKVGRIGEKLDKRAVAISKPVEPYFNAETASQRIAKLTDFPEGKVSFQGSRYYDEASKIAEDTGAYLTEDSVESIFRTVRGEQKESVFKKFPALFKKIETVFSPVIDPAKPSVIQFDPADYKEVRSLQKEINTEYARLSPNSPTYNSDRAALTELRKSLDAAMQKDFPEELVTKLKDAGMQYAHDLTLRNFSREVFTDGKIDPKKAEKWLLDENNLRAVHNIIEPNGLRLSQTIGQPSRAVARLMEKKDSLNSLTTKLQRMRIQDISGMSPDEITNAMKSNPKFLDQFFTKYGKNKEVLRAAQSFMLDDIINSPNSLKELMENKSASLAYNRVLGPGYGDKVKQLAEWSDMIAKNPADIKFSLEAGVTKDLLDELVNVPFSQVASRARNPIRSKTQSAIELITKSLVARSANQFDEKLQAALLSPENLADSLKLVNIAVKGGEIPIGLQKKMWNWLKEAGQASATGGVRGTMVGANLNSEEARAQ